VFYSVRIDKVALDLHSCVREIVKRKMVNQCKAITVGGYRCSHSSYLEGYCLQHWWMAIEKQKEIL
jgi:hypothetical protein